MKIAVVIGLGFGDEGKGNFTNYLCSQLPNPGVVRFSGGQQAGHTVIHNGLKHVFSNYTSGGLQNVPGLTKHTCTMYPATMYIEYQVLERKGITPNLTVHPLTMVTTPYDVAYGRARERAVNHGSCGLGIGSTMSRNENTDYKLYARDLQYPIITKAKLQSISRYYSETAKQSELYPQYYDELNTLFPDFEEALANLDKLFRIDSSFVEPRDSLIYEGSQGLMLDRHYGIFPNVTYAHTGLQNLHGILKSNLDLDIYFITRCYQTRHGAGWMSNDTPVTLVNTEEEINVKNEWQSDFRTSELDYDVLNYAINCVEDFTGDHRIFNKIDTHLVVTCLDQRPDFEFNYDKLKYDFKSIYNSYSPESTLIKQIK